MALGAFGAHALKNILDDYGRSIYEKAVLYQMFHSLALIAIGILQKQFSQLNLDSAGWAMIIGIIVFSGSLYILAVSQIKIFGAITPIGGVAFIVGWIILIIKLMKI